MASHSSPVPFVAGVVLVAASVAEAVGVFVQARGGPSEADWTAVKTQLAATLTESDGLLIGTRWIEPLARQKLGDGLLTRERLGAGASTFSRVAVVSERGHASLPAGYIVDDRVVFGDLDISRAHAAVPFRVNARFESLLSRASVVLDANGVETPCTWGVYGSTSGNLGTGPAIPAERFSCPGLFVVRSVVTDTAYVAHDAVYTDVPGDGRTVVVRWPDVAMGTALRGGFGLYVEAERDGTGAPISVEWRINGRSVATLSHRDGEGWKPFEIATNDLAGSHEVVELRLRSPGGSRRWIGVSAAVVEARP